MRRAAMSRVPRRRRGGHSRWCWRLTTTTRAAPWMTTWSCCCLGMRCDASAHSSGSPRPPSRCAPWAALSPSQSSAWSATPRQPPPSGSRASPPCSSSSVTPNMPIMACAPG